MLNPNLHLNTSWFNSAKKSTRDGFGEALVELGETNKQVVVLTADLKESTKVEAFATKYPDRFYDVGVAEQNLAGISAGMASTGLIPFCSSYAMFQPGRSWDQIRNTICYSHLNVKFVSSHAGLTVGPDGATHQALEDLALTQSIPNLTIVCPCDYEQAKLATFAIAESWGPVYLRLSRASSHQITTSKTPFELGKAQILKFGESCTIITTGTLVAESLKAAEEINAEVINIHTIKPLDTNTILQSVKKTKKVIIAEEHQQIGGLGTTVAQVLAEHYPVPMRFVGVKDKFGQSGTADELLKAYGLTWEHIIASAKSF